MCTGKEAQEPQPCKGACAGNGITRLSSHELKAQQKQCHGTEHTIDSDTEDSND